jgi:hypothetical protein
VVSAVQLLNAGVRYPIDQSSGDDPIRGHGVFRAGSGGDQAVGEGTESGRRGSGVEVLVSVLLLDAALVFRANTSCTTNQMATLGGAASKSQGKHALSIFFEYFPNKYFYENIRIHTTPFHHHRLALGASDTAAIRLHLKRPVKKA